jgi:hypothetical protein
MIPCVAVTYCLAALLALGASPAPAADPADLDQARALAAQLGQQLGAALRREMGSTGPEGAVSVCRQLAPDIAGTLSRESGTRVARVSLKPRNAMLGQPDAWEQAVLAEFDRRAAAD